MQWHINQSSFESTVQSSMLPSYQESFEETAVDEDAIKVLAADQKKARRQAYQKACSRSRSRDRSMKAEQLNELVRLSKAVVATDLGERGRFDQH